MKSSYQLPVHGMPHGTPGQAGQVAGCQYKAA